MRHVMWTWPEVWGFVVDFVCVPGPCAERTGKPCANVLLPASSTVLWFNLQCHSRSKGLQTRLLQHRVLMGPDKCWIMKNGKSDHEKSLKWAFVLKKCWYLITVVLGHQLDQYVGCGLNEANYAIKLRISSATICPWCNCLAAPSIVLCIVLHCLVLLSNL